MLTLKSPVISSLIYAAAGAAITALTPYAAASIPVGFVSYLLLLIKEHLQPTNPVQVVNPFWQIFKLD